MLSFLLSIMLDGFPQVKTPAINIYVYGALMLISGDQVSPQIVAAAISRVWQKISFRHPFPNFWTNVRK
jgi:hypothetical protein